MQLYKEVTRHAAGEGESYVEIKTNGKRCIVIEKLIGSSAKRTDIDANGAAYMIRQRLDNHAKLDQYERQDLGLTGIYAEPDIHSALKDIMDREPRAQHSPLMARWVWAQCHPMEVA